MYHFLTIAVFAAAVAFRLILCWANPPANSFDNHYEPVFLIFNTWHVPAKDACFLCFHPPVFYYSSALAAQALHACGLGFKTIMKPLQFLNCLYGILTLFMIHLILKKYRLPAWARFAAFGTICFLPRHVFLSAMFSNDCLSFLAVAVCLYLLLVTIDRKLSLPLAALTGLAVSLAIFIKYTAFITIPMVAVPLCTLLFIKCGIPRSKTAAALFCALFLPLVLLGTYCASNNKEYGQALPANESISNFSISQPHDPEGIRFASFTPWQYMQEPILVPGHMHSFWTLIYSGMWVDDEPRFTYFTDIQPGWWKQYLAWLRGEAGFPQSAIPISGLTRMLAFGLLAVGLVPLYLFIIGLLRCVRRMLPQKDGPVTIESVKLQPLPLLFAFNAVGIILLTLKFPVYSCMKAAYFLGSMPAFAVCMALSIENMDTKKWMQRAVLSVAFILMLLTSATVFRITWSLLTLPWASSR